MHHKKKLIEVALPLDAINAASAREKSIRHGHPSTLHLWWARRPLAAARAVIFAQMVDDPSAHPDLFPTEKKQEKERQRLFRIIEDLVKWENTTNEEVLGRARNEIWQSWRRTCAENADHPRAKELFDRHKLPPFHDPFAGGGALPLEAQRLGLESYASDLNPVAVLINKAMIEIPPRFAGRPPVNPEARTNEKLFEREWKGAEGLAQDVRYYGRWMRDEAERSIGHLYPKVEVTSDMAKERPDLKPYVGQKLTVIAWLWARTVKSPNPAFGRIDVPLTTTFLLSTQAGKEAFVQPVLYPDGGGYDFVVRAHTPVDFGRVSVGTKLSRGANFVCVMSGTPISGEYVKAEAQAGRMGARLLAVVAEGEHGRAYLSPTSEMEALAQQVKPAWVPTGQLAGKCRDQVPLYGMDTFADLFSGRQLLSLTTFVDLVARAREVARADAIAAQRSMAAGDPRSGEPDVDGYSAAIGTMLAFLVSRLADRMSTVCSWNLRASQGRRSDIRNVFARQAIPMTWDFAEANPFSGISGSVDTAVERIADVLERLPAGSGGHSDQRDAAMPIEGDGFIISTDPPYYDNISYADLSDYFYVWLRPSLRETYPELFSTLLVPKADELIASKGRHGSRQAADAFFLNRMTEALSQLARRTMPGFPVTVYYAFKQAEDDGTGVTSTGWETFLDAVLRAGLSVTGTWPTRTESGSRLIGKDANALASSIVLVCRPRDTRAATVTRREFVTALQTELPLALRDLQAGSVAPVDLAQAAIGPGMGVFTRYAKVLDVEGNPLSVRQALALINQTLDEVLTEQEGDFDVDSRWALAWFDQQGFGEGPYGLAETLSKAKNTSVEGMVESGILASKAGKVRLLRPDELPVDWDPEDDRRTNAWEMLHHLVRVLEHGGESAAAHLLTKYGSKADVVRELAYRLYTACERRKRAKEAGAYNGLVQSWPEIVRLASEKPTASVEQGGLFDRD